MRPTRSSARTAEGIMSMLDSYIYQRRAATGHDPLDLHLNQAQYSTLKEWAEKRPRQDKVVSDGSGLKYRDVRVRVK